MNGIPLPRDHGYACRALVHGFAGARNCKCIKEVSLEPATSMKPWHENAYLGFSPDITFEDDLYLCEKSPKVHLRIQSILCYPPPNSTVGGINAEYIDVKGMQLYLYKYFSLKLDYIFPILQFQTKI